MRSDAANILASLGFKPLVDFDAHAKADGTVEILWRSAHPQPTEADIAAAALPAAKGAKIGAIRTEARTRIESTYPEWRQRSAALGVYPAEYVTQMQADIATVIAASNTGEDAVDAAADVAAVEAVTVTWPVI